jgi:protocatechuate 3,4-dioxygenase beta subunit
MFTIQIKMEFILKKGNETGWAKHHGYLRGWIKTDSDGKYTFYTLKPSTYPSRSASAHIHPVILEPDGKYYWIEDYLFDDDPLLTESDRNRDSLRGGNSGILILRQEENLWIGERNIVLGKNISDYND